MICSKCGKEVGEATFCPYCGEAINTGARVGIEEIKQYNDNDRKYFKRMWIPILIGIAALMFMAGFIFTKYFIENSRKYVKLIDCFDATMDADSYLCKMDDEIQIEVFGKEENTILTMESDGVILTGTNVGWLKDGIVDMELSNNELLQEGLQAIAARDVSFIYNQLFYPLFGVNYTDLRAAGKKLLIDCVTSKKEVPFVSVTKEDNRYFFTIDLEEFQMWLQREGYDIDMGALEYDYSEMEIVIEIAEGYINKFSVEVSSDYGKDHITFTFSKINEVTTLNSIGAAYLEN